MCKIQIRGERSSAHKNPPRLFDLIINDPSGKDVKIEMKVRDSYEVVSLATVISQVEAACKQMKRINV